MGEEFKQAARKYNVKFSPSSDVHRDNSRDSMADTRNAIDTMKRYILTKQEFSCFTRQINVIF